MSMPYNNAAFHWAQRAALARHLPIPVQRSEINGQLFFLGTDGLWYQGDGSFFSGVLRNGFIAERFARLRNALSLVIDPESSYLAIMHRRLSLIARTFGFFPSLLVSQSTVWVKEPEWFNQGNYTERKKQLRNTQEVLLYHRRDQFLGLSLLFRSTKREPPFRLQETS